LKKNFSSYNKTSSDLNKNVYKTKTIQSNIWKGCHEYFLNSGYQYKMNYMEFKKLWRKKKGKLDDII